MCKQLLPKNAAMQNGWIEKEEEEVESQVSLCGKVV